MPSHAIAALSGDRKQIPNKSEEQVLSAVVLTFVSSGIITAKWAKKVQSYQELELRIYETHERWDKKAGPLSATIKGTRNQSRNVSRTCRENISEKASPHVCCNANPRQKTRLTRTPSDLPRV